MSDYEAVIMRHTGLSVEEQISRYDRKEDYHSECLRGNRELMENVLKGIIKRAEQGQLDAVEWLERHQLIEWPGKDGCWTL